MGTTSIYVKEMLRGIIREAGSLLEENFPREPATIAIERKGVFDYATKMDKMSEEFILQKLRQGGFEGVVVAEETGTIRLGSSDITLFLDPLDGTLNYWRGDPDYSIGVAIREKDTFTYSLIYDPHNKELFEAERGGGAFLNGSPIKVSEKASFDESMIVFNWWYSPMETKTAAQVFEKLLTAGMWNLKSKYSDLLDLAYVASGRRDGLIFVYSEAKPWDIAPGALLVEEAGGIVTNGRGEPWFPCTNSLIAGGKSIHKKLLSVLQERG